MDIKSVWLLYHKASLALDSPQNLDGSTSMKGVGVVPALDMKAAIVLFEEHLLSRKMELLWLWTCEQWSPENFTGDSLADEQINLAASKALENNKIHYTCGISSEASGCE